jgi:hypothetical protein
MKPTNSVISISHNLLGSGLKSAPNRTEYLIAFPASKPKDFNTILGAQRYRVKAEALSGLVAILHSDVPCRWDLLCCRKCGDFGALASFTTALLFASETTCRTDLAEQLTLVTGSSRSYFRPIKKSLGTTQEQKWFLE